MSFSSLHLIAGNKTQAVLQTPKAQIGRIILANLAGESMESIQLALMELMSIVSICHKIINLLQLAMTTAWSMFTGTHAVRITQQEHIVVIVSM